MALGGTLLEVTRDLQLGANIDFDFLGDDDDSDDSGGASLTAQFDAIPTSSSYIWPAYSAIPMDVTVTGHNGPQTNGVFTVYVLGEIGGDTVVTSITGTVLNGWTQTGWSIIASNVWGNTFTKASLIAEYSATVSFQINTINGPATIFVDATSGGVPQTDQATGNGGEFNMTLQAA